MSLTYEYSNCWKDLGSILVYRSDGFQFRSRVIITEFENCLIRKLASNKMYHAINPKSITPYNEIFLKMIKDECLDNSIVIISNVFGGGKLVIDALKRKVELFLATYQIPVLCLFAIKPNRMSKPHTGIWKFLNSYYKRCGSSLIHKACVISDTGGRLIEHESKQGSVRITSDLTDLDRAFAHNISMPYHTINEYLDSDKKEKFNWNSACLPPDVRELHIQKLSEYKNPNIFAKLFELGKSDTYMIMIYGAPRSGKTTLSRDLMAKWRTSAYGKTHAIKRFGTDKYTRMRRITQVRKAIEDRISVIVDGGMHTPHAREPYEIMAKANFVKILYVEVNIGLGMSNILNHVAVETSQDENLELYDIKEYHFYQSRVARPPGVVLYCPTLKKTKEVMLFRY